MSVLLRSSAQQIVFRPGLADHADLTCFVNGWDHGLVLEWFRDASPLVVLAVAVGENISINAASAVVWRLTAGAWGTRPINQRDIRLTASTTLINSLVVMPGWWLWREGYLDLAPISPTRWILETVYLLLIVDIAMYVAHRACHWNLFYERFHSWHHRDDHPTALSLFVMHPFEAAAFGVTVIIAMLVYPVSLIAVTLFFTANLLVGTYAHLPDDVIGPKVGKVRPLAWIQGFHQRHHAEPSKNFGFFSPVWDRFGGTKAD